MFYRCTTAICTAGIPSDVFNIIHNLVHLEEKPRLNKQVNQWVRESLDDTSYLNNVTVQVCTFVHKLFMWNSNEQFLDINMPRSKTLLVGFMMSMFC